MSDGDPKLDALRQQLDAATRLATQAHGDAQAARLALVGTELQPGLRSLYGGLASDVHHLGDRVDRMQTSLEHWLGGLDRRLQEIAARRPHPLVTMIAVGSLVVLAGSALSFAALAWWWLSQQLAIGGAP